MYYFFSHTNCSGPGYQYSSMLLAQLLPKLYVLGTHTCFLAEINISPVRGRKKKKNKIKKLLIQAINSL